MKSFFLNTWKRIAARPLISSVLALALIAPLAGYEIVNPVGAHASASPMAAASAPLDASSVSAITDLDRAVETLASRVTPAVVNVNVTAKVKPAMQQFGNQNDPFSQFFGRQFGFQFGRPQPQIEHGVGSGFVISPDGYIVTNNHVVKGATDVNVTFSDKRVMTAKVVGTDPLTDLAVIKVNATGLTTIPWGDSTALRPGQSVFAFGNPMGNYPFSMTRGIVSALNRPNPDGNPHNPGQYIQTDAAINPGNSGGPLVDARGEVMGINTFLVSATGGFSGLGFAIPAQIARPITAELIQSGKVEHAHIGVTINDMTPSMAKFFHIDKATGAVISQVDPGSPGDKAGLKVGDVITGVDGKSVGDAGSLQVEISDQRPGTTVNLQVMRDGSKLSVPVTLTALNLNGEAETAANGEHRGRWGVGIGDLTPADRDQLQLPASVKGAVVEQVAPGSPADNAALQRGDVIQSVNRKPTPNAEAVKDALAAVPAGQDALILVWSNGGSGFRVLHSAGTPSS